MVKYSVMFMITILISDDAAIRYILQPTRKKLRTILLSLENYRIKTVRIIKF